MIPLLSSPYALIVDKKTNASKGGSSIAGLQIRELNTIVSDFGNIIMLLNNNQLMLEKGVYRFRCSAPAFKVKEHQAFIYNVGSSSYIADGATAKSEKEQTTSVVNSGDITLNVQTVIDIRHWTKKSKNKEGLGIKADDSANRPNIYTQLEIWKIS